MSADHLPEKLELQPITRVEGQVALPGSKSLSNRYLLLAALSSYLNKSTQTVELTNFLESDDTQRLADALQQLGWSVERLQADPLRNQGSVLSLGGQFSVSEQSRRLFLGNAGTAYRPLTAALCAFPGRFILEGEPRMYERPIGPLVQALRQLGAEVKELGSAGFPPLEVGGSSLRGGSCQLDVSLSSQYLSSLLMAAPLAKDQVEIELVGEQVSPSYVQMTIGLLKHFGIAVDFHSSPRPSYTVRPQTFTCPATIQVESDATSASYFLAAGAIGGGPVRVVGVGRDSCQGELAFADVLQEMGAQVEWGSDWVQVSRPSDTQLRGLSKNLNDMPDAAMTLAMVALFANSPTAITGVANWKIKETDRQAALYQELTKIGATVELLQDGIRVHPLSHADWRSSEIETYQDHRMAMCFSLAAFGPKTQTILNPACVSKTFPDYFLGGSPWKRLQKLA
jgi:3-phosphoshikimate 1-carboxyvinyltransferase